jgi:phosphatidylglycerol:prolipoprotein diacylglycerol transferase
LGAAIEGYKDKLAARIGIGYGLGRFWIEGLRSDSLYLVPGLRISQALSLVLIIFGIIIIVFHNKLFKKTTDYTGKYMIK